MRYTVEVEETRTCWYKEGTDICHREDGPAREWDDGTKEWWMNDCWHREDGPAIEWPDGSKRWYLNDKELTEEEFNSRQRNSITINGKTKEIPQEALDLLKDLL